MENLTDTLSNILDNSYCLAHKNNSIENCFSNSIDDGDGQIEGDLFEEK